MSSTAEKDPQRDEGKRFDVIVVGAGFAGMYLLHRLRGMGLTTRLYEAGHSVGGTWYWNRYPGARCDAESLAYSYSFSSELETEWNWSERYATQPRAIRVHDRRSAIHQEEEAAAVGRPLRRVG